MANPNRSNCVYCAPIRSTPRAVWENCLNFRGGACPVIGLNKNNVIAPAASQQSRAMRNSLIVKLPAAGNNRWRTVNWRKFQLQKQTKEYQTRIVTNSSNNPSGLVIRHGYVVNPQVGQQSVNVLSNCPGATNLTWDQIARMSEAEVSANLGSDIPITCETLGVEQIVEFPRTG